MKKNAVENRTKTARKPRRLRKPKSAVMHFPELVDRQGVRSIVSAPIWWRDDDDNVATVTNPKP